jgi:hypothetical protein
MLYYPQQNNNVSFMICRYLNIFIKGVVLLLLKGEAPYRKIKKENPLFFRHMQALPNNPRKQP